MDDVEKKGWQKYPMERVIMNQQKHKAFVEKCRTVGIAKSRALNLLIDKWLSGKIKIKK